MLATLRSTWTDSLQFFISSDAKLFPLLMLNSLKRIIMTLGHYFFWLIPLALYAHMQLVRELLAMGVSPDGRVSSLQFILCSATGLLLSFVIILSARASLEAKNMFYFIYYLPRIIPFAVIWFFPDLALFPWVWLTSLFFLDGNFDIKNFGYSWYRGAKMMLCYAPAFIGYGFGVVVLLQALRFGSMFILGAFAPHSLTTLLVADFVFALLFQLVMAAMVTTLYISIKHRNYKLFFE